MSKALELAKFGRESAPTGAVIGDTDTQTLSAKTFSDSPIFSSGTANGVPYLNGSKVFTTGSALVFDGTNLGVGVASPTAKLHVGVVGDNETVIARFGTTSTGSVLSSLKILSDPSTSTVKFDATGAVGNNITFLTGGTERVRFDNNGQVAVGSSPNAGWVGTKSIMLGQSASFYGDGQTYNWPAGIATNAYRTNATTWKYQAPTASLLASWRYEQGNVVDGWGWFYAATGAIDTTISYSQLMKLTSSGNFGVGIDPSYKLHVNGDAYIVGNTYVPGKLIQSSLTSYPQQSISLSVGTATWVKMFTITSPGGCRVRYNAGSNNSEEQGEFTVKGTYVASGTQLTWTRQTYYHNITEIRVTGSNSTPYTVWALVRTTEFVPSFNWQVIEALNSVTLYNTTGETPGTAVASINSPGYNSTNFTGDSIVNGNQGIGTYTPYKKSHIVGGALAIDSSSATASGVSDAGQTNNLLYLRTPYSSNAGSVTNNGMKWGIRFVGRAGDNVWGEGKAASIYAVSEEDTGAGYNRKVGLSFWTSGFDLDQAERLRIDNNGRVIINPTQATNYTAMLDIYGGGGATALGAIRIGDGNYASGHTNYWDIGRDNNVSGDFTFALNTSEKMRIKTNGKVGIGTTDPQEILHVQGKMRLFDGGYPYIDLGISTSNYWRIINDNPNDVLKIGKNGAASFMIDATGNSYVNSSNPSTGINLYIRNTTDTGGDNTRYAGIQFQIGSDLGTAAIQAYRTASASDYSTALVFLTKGTGAPATNPVERMRLNSLGYLGIGTNNPVSALHVVGAVNNTSTSAGVHAGLYAGTYGAVELVSLAGGSSWIDFHDTAGDDYIERIRGGDGALKFYTNKNNTPSVTISSSGAVSLTGTITNSQGGGTGSTSTHYAAATISPTSASNGTAIYDIYLPNYFTVTDAMDLELYVHSNPNGGGSGSYRQTKHITAHCLTQWHGSGYTPFLEWDSVNDYMGLGFDCVIFFQPSGQEFTTQVTSTAANNSSYFWSTPGVYLRVKVSGFNSSYSGVQSLGLIVGHKS
jgi:hypothetical protein